VTKNLVLCLSIAVGVVATGCSGGGPAVAPVTGTVTLDGQPLANASVTFQPIAEGSVDAGPASTATTDAQGAFVLKTAEGEEGAVVGKHRIMVFSAGGGAGPQDEDNIYGSAPAEKVPAQYNTQTTLEFEVPPGGSTAANFELSSQGGAGGRPPGDFGS